MPRRKAPPAAPPLLEWNFGDCPSDELVNCRPYEYTRSSPLLREAVTRKRAGQLDQVTDQALVHIFPLDADWVRDYRWWPDTEYLAIPPTVRRGWLPSQTGPITLARLCDPTLYLDAPERIIRVHIPPFSLSVVKQAFGDMLLRDYPHLLKKQWSEEQIKLFKTGQGSSTQQDRSLLKALSARRLQLYGFTALQALALACAHGVETYASIRAWRNAARKARNEVARLEAKLPS